MSASDGPTDPRRPGLADTEADDTAPKPKVAAWTLAGYELGSVLGRGGMGEVVAAQDQRIEREVAVKRMRAAEPSPDAVARFLREAKIQARLDHPAIVPVHELGTDAAGLPYFTMKRLAGTTLAKRLEDPGPPQPLLRALVDVCFAIELAHTRGVVHRDLKPSNIMLGDYGDVYVLDWGVARVLGTARTSSQHLPLDSLPPAETGTGVMLGTPGYMAPEQIRGDDVGTPADVFALGAILFEILASEPLHRPGTGAIASTLVAPGDSPARRRPDRAIAPELDALCVAALSDDPSRRPTARVLAESVQRFLDGDRDLERRRAAGHEQLALARIALASGRRADAVHAAGRALALDPGSADAIELVTSLIVEPPPEIPAELAVALAREDRRLDRERSRRAVLPLLALYLYLPFVPFVHVASWSLLVGVFAVTTFHAALNWLDARGTKVAMTVHLGANLAFAVMFSRVAGVFVIAPTLVTGLVLAISGRSWAAARPWLIVTWAFAAMLIPFALEALGWFAPTWEMTPRGMLSWSTIVDSHRPVDTAAMVFGTVALIVVIAFYAMGLARDRRDAQRRVQIQAWHLRQLLPHGAARLPSDHG